MKKVIIPIPNKDFDPSEVAIPWKILTENAVQVFFATPEGRQGECDMLMLTGKKLGILKPILQADLNARRAYDLMLNSKNFQNPLKWSQLHVHDFDGVILPGGHAQGVKEYLESNVLQTLVSQFFKLHKPVGAICHGVVLAARSQAENGKSVLYGRKTTALLQTQELSAWGLTVLWLKDYYRTYKQTVEGEVRRALAQKDDFVPGPMPMKRDSSRNLKAGFAVVDKNYVSARWPGDVHTFSYLFMKVLNQSDNI